MAGSSEVKTLLSRHKASLLRELNTTDLLSVLVKRGVITEIDKEAVAGNAERSTQADIDLFIDIIGAKGFDAFREFCFSLEAECPHVLTDLLVDQHAITGEQRECGEEEAKREQKLREQEAVDAEDVKIVDTETMREQETASADVNVSRESDDCIKECKVDEQVMSIANGEVDAAAWRDSAFPLGGLGASRRLFSPLF